MRQIAFLLIMSFLVGCGPMTKEDAMEKLSEKEVYNSYFYAPIHIGKQVAALDEGASLDTYIEEHYGLLQSAGLISIDILSRSSWRNVFAVSLTDKGRELCDKERSDNEHAFVAVFKVVPESVDTLIPLEDGRMECRYVIVQKDLTPFGEFLEFDEGRKYHLIDTLR